MSMTKRELDKIYKNGKYAWPGGYEIVFIMDDGELVCFECAVENRTQIEDALTAGYRDGWKPEGITYVEEMDLSPGETELCAHCNRVVKAEEEGAVMFFDRFDIAEAYYLALTHCHGGQWSESYARLCKLSRIFTPSPLLRVETLSENGRAIYEKAVVRYLSKPPGRTH